MKTARSWVLGAMLVLAAGVLSGCACLSGGEYASQCGTVCCTVCTEGCIPLCVDTCTGRGPANNGSASSASAAALLDPSAQTVQAEVPLADAEPTGEFAW